MRVYVARSAWVRLPLGEFGFLPSFPDSSRRVIDRPWHHAPTSSILIHSIVFQSQLSYFLQGTTTVSSVAILFLLASPLTLPGRANLAVKCLLGVSAAQVCYSIARSLPLLTMVREGFACLLKEARKYRSRKMRELLAPSVARLLHLSSFSLTFQRKAFRCFQ